MKREQEMQIKAVADLFGAAVEFQKTRNNHVRAILSYGEQKTTIVMCRAPGDWRATHNNLALIRRTLRTMTERQTIRTLSAELRTLRRHP